MKLMLLFVVFLFALTNHQCTSKDDSKKKYTEITISVSDQVNNIQLKWNGNNFTNGTPARIESPNTLQIIRGENTIVEFSIDMGANYINKLDISVGNQTSCNNKTLHGHVFKSIGNNIPIKDRTVYNNTFVYTTTDSNGFYKLCFGDGSYDYGYTRAGWNNDVKVTVKKQNDPDLKIDVYMDDSEPIIPGEDN